MKPKDNANTKKERPREFSNNTSTRRLSKMTEVEELKKKGFKIEANTAVPNMNTISASEKRNSLAISPMTPQTPLSFHDGTPNSTTSSKTLGNAPVQMGNVSVMCRFRPLNEKEKLLTKDICVEFVDSQQLNLRSTAENNCYKFAFDRIFDMNSTQQPVYDAAAKPIIDSVLEGFNGTIFAYGQTSSGKTHTMQGILDSPEEEGIIPRMIRNVFSHIMNSSEDIEFTVKVSMIEIYMEKIRDLIDVTRSNLNIREDRAKGLYIEDLSEHYVGGESEVLELMKVGSENRAIAATNMNEQSSRSHSIFIMTIHQNNVKDLVAKTGKLYLVDLAGSEKISKTGATGSVLDEAKMINKSLTTLGMVINNLTDGKSQHIPYRESKLTRVLSESLGGNAKTCLVITCSPSTYNESETLSTLRFGLRAKKIKNKPKINKEVTVAELKLEIDKLERFLITCNRRIGQLENFISKNNLSPPKEGDFSFLEGDDKKAKVINMIEEDLDKLKEEDLIINESDHLDNLYFTNDARYKIPVYDENDDKDKILDDISNKYAGVMAQLNLVEEDKKELNYKLEDAISKIKDFSDTLEHKERLIDELGDIKRNFEQKEQELFEKIKDLQDKLEEKHLITCENYDKSKSNSDIGYASQNEDISNNNSNNNIDVTNNFEEINFKSDLINLNMNLEENKEVDEIYLKIQEVINTCKDGKPANLQFNTLVEMIKNKININDEEVYAKNIETESKVEDGRNIFVNKINKNINSLNVSVIEKIEQFGIIKTASNTIPTVSNVASSLNVTLSNTNNTSARASIIETPSASPLISEEAFKKEKRKYEHEKKLILKALEEKSERIGQFENENKELKERIKLIESKMNPDDKNYVKKIISLEKNLDQVNLMYHQVVTQKSVLKIENQVYEKKIKKRNEKISSLEKDSTDLREQIKLINEKIAHYQKHMIKPSAAPNNVVRVIKGGTSKKVENLINILSSLNLDKSNAVSNTDVISEALSSPTKD